MFATDVERQIEETWVKAGTVRFVYRHMAFLGQESQWAAEAAECAGEQNKFWEYHDKLFDSQKGENQGAFSNNRLEAFAEAVGLEMNDFNTCFGQNRYQDEIDADKASGDGAGVTGTPSVFVNGRILTPGRVPSFSQISEAVEAELANSSN